ncbi:hypothetical protein P3T36_003396, partial [Kitasatospora sp. MAP12-15]
GTVLPPGAGTVPPSGTGTGPSPGTVPPVRTGTVPPIGTAAGVGTGTGDRPEPVPKRSLSDKDLKALLPIARKAAAEAEGRVTRDVLRAGFKDEGVGINNKALGQVLAALKDAESKPPPARR